MTDLSTSDGSLSLAALRYHGLQLPAGRPEAGPVRRIPSATIRLRVGRKNLTHGMRLGWRLSWPEEFPVTISKISKETP